MKSILDAHALLWFFAGSSKLSANAQECIQNPANTLFVSPATFWEISIKDALGKLTLSLPFEQLFPNRLEASNILILPILVPIFMCNGASPTITTIRLTGSKSLKHWRKISPSFPVIQNLRHTA